jgi:hypothetical protein
VTYIPLSKPIRSAQDVIDVARSRGLEINIDPGPPLMPVLHRPANIAKAMVTDTLLGALRAWRLEIIDIVRENHAG